MIFYNDGDIIIRDMRKEDIEIIHSLRLSYGWNSQVQTFERYFDSQENNNVYIFIAEYCNNIAGYTTMKPQATVGPFANKGIPEITDFNVFTKLQRKGIGSKILDIAESIASKTSTHVSLGVGLHNGYGAAQRMYVKRGYVPDGSGVWYDNKQLEPYTNCRNDDSLLLYFSKELRAKKREVHKY